MKYFIMILLLSGILFTDNVFAATEISREGICGDYIARPGPNPYCEDSQNTCYIKIYYDDGSTGEEMAVYEAGQSLGYSPRVFDVYTQQSEDNEGFYYHIDVKPNCDIFPAYSADDVMDWINSH